jgi:hypothetical protein
LREQSFSRLFGRARKHKGRSKKEDSETYEGQERTALSTEAGQVQKVPQSNLRGIMPNDIFYDEFSSELSLRPGAVRIPGANETVDDEDKQKTSTSLAPELMEPEILEAELALDLDEAIALGLQQTVQATVLSFPPTAAPVRRRPWKTIASMFILALAAILTAVWLTSKMLSQTASETPTGSRVPSETPSSSSSPSGTPSMSSSPSGTRSSSPSGTPSMSSSPSGTPSMSLSPTEDRVTPLQSFLAPYFGDGFPISETEQEALYWLAYEDDAMLMPPVPGSDSFDSLNSQLLERYIAVLFFFGTGGGDWHLNEGWLSGNPVCRWYGVSCLDSLGCPIDEISDIVLGEFL